jgi:putative phosphoribosyl transferase
VNQAREQVADSKPPFRIANRIEAGRLLADRLIKFRGGATLILALPRGGVPVGFEIARQLMSPLDTINVKKVGAPGNPEYGIGAVGPDHRVQLDRSAMWAVGANENEIGLAVGLAIQEVDRRNRVYQSGRANQFDQTRSIIIVDDGMATGASARVAITTVRDRYPATRIILAVPVSSQAAQAEIEPLVEQFVCLYAPPQFISVGEWYVDFKQLTDTEVLKLLHQANLWLTESASNKTTHPAKNQL